MTKDIIATSQNIENVTNMLDSLSSVRDDSSKLREISLDNTGWEGMDATSFNTALNNFTQKLDKTVSDIEETLSSYKTKQEEQLEQTEEAKKVADSLDERKDAIRAGAAIGAITGGLPGMKFGADAAEYLTRKGKKIDPLNFIGIFKKEEPHFENIDPQKMEEMKNRIQNKMNSGGAGRKFESPSINELR